MDKKSKSKKPTTSTRVFLRNPQERRPELWLTSNGYCVVPSGTAPHAELVDREVYVRPRKDDPRVAWEFVSFVE